MDFKTILESYFISLKKEKRIKRKKVGADSVTCHTYHKSVLISDVIGDFNLQYGLNIFLKRQKNKWKFVRFSLVIFPFAILRGYGWANHLIV